MAKYECRKCGQVVRGDVPREVCACGGEWAFMFEAGPGRCEEASPMSGERYIPCNAPAVVVVDWAPRTDRPIRMCAMCADHNVRNRGGRVVRELTADERTA